MSVRVQVHVGEDARLDDHVGPGMAGVPNGWLYLGGECEELAVWGSAAALRRLAAALILVAERADELRALREALTAGASGTSGREAVTGT